MPSPLRVCALGPFCLERDGRAAPKFLYLDAREMLLYVMLFTTRDNAGNWRGRSKQEIGAALWGDVSDAQLNARFKARLNDLRRVLGAREWIVFEENEYKFDFARGVWFDVREFLQHCANADAARRTKNLDAERAALEQAIALFRGDFMQDYQTRRRREFRDEREWYLAFREETRHTYRGALERSAELESDAARFDDALELYRKLVTLDEYDDSTHAQLMLTLTALGKRGQALRHFQTLTQTRPDVPPDTELTALYERIKRYEASGTPERGAVNLATSPLASAGNHLPHQQTKFIGRVREREELGTLSKRTQLLTLTGAGGSGKTRLALQVGAELLDEFEKGVWFVELAPLADGVLVPNAVMTALELRDEIGRTPLDILTDFLRAKKLLLILDNCEHLIEACARLAQHLLTHCPHLQILATSREALGIPGEIVYSVPTLALPDPKQHLPVASLSQYDAVKLFIERAAAVQPAFAVTNNNAPAVAQICYRLDGIPLAIELAAARIKLFSPEQLAARLDERLRVLTSGSRTATPRQQTLRGAIDWSYSLLSEQERILFRRLAVFVGGWTFEAAEQVCADDEIDSFEILDLLAQLLNKSLVTTEPRGQETRYRMLETIREYASEKLRKANEVGALRDKHLDYFVSFAEQAEPHLRRTEQLEWFERLDADLDNCRAALEWAEQHARPLVGLRIAAGLEVYWEVRGAVPEGRAWLEKLLAKDDGIRGTREYARGLVTAAGLARNDSESAHIVARQRAQAALVLFREQNDSAGIAKAFFWLSQFSPDTAETMSLLEEMLALSRAAQDQPNIALALDYLGGNAVFGGEKVKAKRVLDEGLALARELGDRVELGNMLNSMSFYEMETGDWESAVAHVEERAALYKELGYQWGMAWSYSWLASITNLYGKYEQAKNYALQSLKIWNELGTNEHGKVEALLFCAWTSMHLQEDSAIVQQYVRQALEVANASKNKMALIVANFGLGHVEMFYQNFDRAQILLRQSLVEWRDLGNVSNCVDTLFELASATAQIATRQENRAQMIRAATLDGAAHALYTKYSQWMPTYLVSEREKVLPALRKALGEQELDTAWQQGRALSLEQAIELALKEA